MNRLYSRSIRFRLTAWYTGILAITFAVVAAGVWLALRESTRVTVDKELRSRLATVRAYVNEQTGDDNVTHLVDELSEEAVMTSAATNLRIADARGKWIYRSRATERWSLDPPRPDGLPANGRTQTVNANGMAVRIVTAPVKIGVVQIGLPLDELEEVQYDFLWSTAVGAPVLLVLAALAGFWMSGRALRPVDQIAAAARRISGQNLSERLPATGAGDELDRLSEVLNDMLQRLDAAFRKITQFTADASHELRTPIAILRTTAEVTQSRPRTVEEHCQAWGVVQAQAERTSQLVGDLLLLARADAGAGERLFDLLNLSNIIREACAEMHLIAEAKGVVVECGALSDCFVSGDEESLRRALLIVLDNAIKFTAAPGKIFVSMDLGDPEFAVVAVRDTGIGISSDDLPRIFERFYRVAKDRSRATGGAGLGLSIADSILSQHGGRISVESTPGKGTTFRFHLPVSGYDNKATGQTAPLFWTEFHRYVNPSQP